jgi:hypothetical protein
MLALPDQVAQGRASVFHPAASFRQTGVGQGKATRDRSSWKQKGSAYREAALVSRWCTQTFGST